MASRKRPVQISASVEQQAERTEENEVVSAAKALAKLRWKGTTAQQRTEAARVASAGRMVKISPKKRREIAHAAASAISPEAARARAQKAAETRRRNAELRNAG